MNAPWNPNKRSGGLATREPFTAFVCDETTAEMIRSIATEIGWQADKVNKGGLRNAVQTLSVSSSPMILLVDLSESGDPLNDINALAEVCEPGTIVIALGAVNDVRLYRDLLASGIQDYLLKPLSPDALRESLMNAQTMLMAPKQGGQEIDKPRTTVAVLGTRGGVGASSIATSLAWLMATNQSRSTALLDLDVQFGTGALAFDLEPGRGLTDALENPSRIDGLFIERAMVRVSDNLSVLSAEAPINQPLMTDGTALFHLQEEMRNAFECLVVDMPRSVAVQNAHLLQDIQHVVVVSEQTLAGTRDTIRLLGFLKSHAPNAQVTLVTNRVCSTPAPEVVRRDFETSVERKIDVVLPSDPKTACDAAKQGKALVAAAKGGKIVAGMNALLAIIGGTNDESKAATPKSLIGKLGDLSVLLPRKDGAKKDAAKK